MSYEEARANLAELYGWSFDTIDNMSFEQIGSACTQGKKSKGIAIHDHKQLEEINKNWRAYYGI